MTDLSLDPGSGGHPRPTARVVLPPDREAFSRFVPALALLLAGYLFFSKTFAYLHLPGTPVFVGELVLGLGLVEVWGTRSPWRRLLRTSPPVVLGAGFLAVGLGRLSVDLPDFGLAAVRDAALWYYAAFGLLTAAVVLRVPQAVPRWVGWYRRVLPVFLLWAPVAVVLGSIEGLTTATVPDSAAALNSFKTGDYSVHLAMAVSFLWLAPDRLTGRPRTRAAVTVGLSLLGLAGLVVSGTQTRGGFLAGGLVLAVTVLALPHGRRRRLALSVGGAVLATVLIVTAADLRLVSARREVSVEQVVLNLASVLDRSSSSEQLDGTARWREQLWDRARDDLVVSDSVLTGIGFGPVLGVRYGVNRADDPSPLRSVHNSHLSVLIRTGAVGLLAWGLLWLTWLLMLLRWIRRSPDGVRDPTVALGAWLLASACGLLANAYFDPSLEGPQASIWLYVLFGVGAVLVRGRPGAAAVPRHDESRSQVG